MFLTEVNIFDSNSHRKNDSADLDGPMGAAPPLRVLRWAILDMVVVVAIVVRIMYLA